MIEQLRRNKWFSMLLSIFLAVAFWLYVRSADNSTYPFWYNNVPVIQTGSNVLATQGLTVASVSNDYVNLRIEATASVHNTINQSRDDLWVTLDVSRCQDGNNQLAYTCSWPVSVNRESIALVDQTPKTIDVVVEQLSTQTFPVEFQLEGRVPDGYQAGTAVITPESVQISGPLDQVSRVARVAAILEEEELNQRFAGDLPLTLLDSEGNVLQSSEIVMDTKSAYVVVPVVVVKEIPLTVNALPGGGATEKDASIKITPATLTVSGEEKDLQDLTEISLGSIDLSKFVGQGTVTRPIELDPSLENVSGITTADISVTITGLYTKTFDVVNISLSDPAAGFRAEAVTQMRTVTVRGQSEELENVDASQIRIVADVSSCTNLGTYSIPARVYLDAGHSVGVIGDCYISVKISN